jgi:hypothetical protein
MLNFILLSVVMQSCVTLNVFKLIFIVWGVIMQSVVMLSFVLQRVVLLSLVVLSALMLSSYAKCHYSKNINILSVFLVSVAVPTSMFFACKPGKISKNILVGTMTLTIKTFKIMTLL